MIAEPDKDSTRSTIHRKNRIIKLYYIHDGQEKSTSYIIAAQSRPKYA
jgi:hypothetical protein